jgi:hypothetical protein
MPKPRDPLQPLVDALDTMTIGHPELADLPQSIAAALKSAIRAIVPGRQGGKNLPPLLHDAQKAFLRTLRRRARR